MKGSHFVKKYSVQFVNQHGKLSEPFYFLDHKPHESSQTWQVIRSEFDQMMLDNAREHGVDGPRGGARAGSAVRGRAGRRRARPAGGRRRAARCGPRWSWTPAGRARMIMDRLGLREWDPVLKKAALWTYWKGAYRDTGRDEGATLVIQTKGKKGWFWYIPLHDDIISVGVVADYDYLFKDRGTKDHETIYFEEVDRCPGVQPRHRRTRRGCDIFRAAKEYSYRSQAGGRRRLGAGRRRLRLPRPALLVRRAAGADLRRDGGRRDRRGAGARATRRRRSCGKWEPALRRAAWTGCAGWCASTTTASASAASSASTRT